MGNPNLRCTLNQPQDLARRGRLIRMLYESAIERRELENGFAFRFSGDAATERQVFDFIAMERDCCRFLSFDVRLAAERGPIWLAMEGPSGLKEFAFAELRRFDIDGEAPHEPIK